MSIDKKFRAVNKSQEKSQEEMLRDVRSMSTVALESLANGTIASSVIIFCAIAPFIEPLSAIPMALVGTFVYWRRRGFAKQDRMPMRLPKVAGVTDLTDMLPGRRGYGKGLGVFYMGRDQNGRELWLKASDMLTHMLVMGTTGSGKTVTLTALASNYICMGGGFIYTDPKAAPSLWRNIHVMARIFGRDDDLRVVNYMTANAQIGSGADPERRTNTLNPFAFGNADQLTQLLTSLIEVSGGDNAVFGQNAMMAVSALMLGLVEKRVSGELELSISTIREWFTAEKMVDLALDPSLSKDTSDSLKSFLKSMGWTEGKEFDKQARSFGEQFQYAKGYFGLALNSLTDTYGHIYRHSAGEVDMFDIIKNRRILLNMLPSLEKSPAELKQIGKVTLSSIRNAIAAGLGGGAEGRIDDVTNSLPLASPVPFGVITDEYAAIPTPGFAEIMTQGRGLGISSITASQDLDGMMGETPTDKKGAMQIVENTMIKIGMKLTGSGETWNMWKGLADEALVMQTQGFSVGGGQSGGGGGKGMFDTSYRDQQSATLTKISRIDLRDFQEQSVGEFHAFVNGDIVRGDMFFDPVFDDPSGMKERKMSDYNLKIVRLAYIEPPSKDELESRIGKIKTIVETTVKRVKSGDYPDFKDVSPTFATINKTMNDLFARHAPSEMMATTAFMAWAKDNTGGGGMSLDLVKEQVAVNNKETEITEDTDETSFIPLEDQITGKAEVPSPASSLFPVYGVGSEDLNSELKEELGKESAQFTPTDHPTKEMLGDEENKVIEDIVDAEISTGIDKELSAKRAQGTINRVKAGSAYPNKPQPTSDASTAVTIDNQVERLLEL